MRRPACAATRRWSPPAEPPAGTARPRPDRRAGDGGGTAAAAGTVVPDPTEGSKRIGPGLSAAARAPRGSSRATPPPSSRPATAWTPATPSPPRRRPRSQDPRVARRVALVGALLVVAVLLAGGVALWLTRPALPRLGRRAAADRRPADRPARRPGRRQLPRRPAAAGGRDVPVHGDRQCRGTACGDRHGGGQFGQVHLDPGNRVGSGARLVAGRARSTGRWRRPRCSQGSRPSRTRSAASSPTGSSRRTGSSARRTRARSAAQQQYGQQPPQGGYPSGQQYGQQGWGQGPASGQQPAQPAYPSGQQPEQPPQGWPARPAARPRRPAQPAQPRQPGYDAGQQGWGQQQG